MNPPRGSLAARPPGSDAGGPALPLSRPVLQGAGADAPRVSFANRGLHG
jgi:hypothetical protein